MAHNTVQKTEIHGPQYSAKERQRKRERESERARERERERERFLKYYHLPITN